MIIYINFKFNLYQETVEDTGSEGANGDQEKSHSKRRMRYNQKRKTVVNPDENFYFHWLMVLTICVLYNLWTLIVRQSFPELQEKASSFWFTCDCISDVVFLCDIAVQLRTGYLEQGLMVSFILISPNNLSHYSINSITILSPK